MASKHDGCWRDRAGFFLPDRVSRQSIKAHFNRFLRDRRSDTLLPSKPIPSGTPETDWGKTVPFEKVICEGGDLTWLMTHPSLHQPAVTIIEPWQNVGTNSRGEEVRASLNLASALQQVADIDSSLFPAWKYLSKIDTREVAGFASRGLAFVVEGGAPSVYDPKTFTHPECPRDGLLELIQHLLLGRKNGGAPGLFICLGHQLACETHVTLLKRAVAAVGKLTALTGDTSGTTLASLRSACAQIQRVGDDAGWNDAQFATTSNEQAELSGHVLTPYVVPEPDDVGLPGEIIDIYESSVTDEGIVDVALQFAGRIKIDMFHRDVATEKAVLFSSWAYTRLHLAVAAHREILAVSDVDWLLRLPYAVKISSSTRRGEKTVTGNAATCILYKDFDTGRLRHSYTTQFHPELLDNLRDLRAIEAPDYTVLKNDLGKRLLIQMLRDGVGE
jgi:hypothetical protein